MPGILIKNRRESLKMTQAELSDLLHMSQSNYSKIENNKIALTVELAKRVGKILNIKIEEILPDDAVVESSLAHQEKIETRIMFMVEEMIDLKLLELKEWLSIELKKSK